MINNWTCDNIINFFKVYGVVIVNIQIFFCLALILFFKSSSQQKIDCDCFFKNNAADKPETPRPKIKKLFFFFEHSS